MDNCRKEAIETFFLDWPFALATGFVFGLAGRREIAAADGPGFSTRAFRWGLAYLHVGFISIAVALYVLRPDWMWMYWVDASAIPIVVVGLAFALYELCFIAGFVIAPALRARVAVAVAIGLGAVLVAAEVVARVRLVRLGSYEAFHAGTLPPDVSLSPLRVTGLGGTLLGLVLASTASLLVLAVRVARRVP